MKKAAIYARYSSDKQTEETIHVQVDKCKAFCERQGILVCGTFADKGKSGTTEGGREEYA
ncbi:MAG: recombinase family protein, partial [Candidatus Handelsmanbacteria bacterium]|nr:recombinase family protein [Candidatus Handelsmanbacteria bacterium]